MRTFIVTGLYASEGRIYQMDYWNLYMMLKFDDRNQYQAAHERLEKYDGAKSHVLMTGNIGWLCTSTLQRRNSSASTHLDKFIYTNA